MGVDLSAPPVETTLFAPRLVAAQLLKAIGYGSLTGFAFGLCDIARAEFVAGTLSWSIAAAVLGLWLWFGQILGAAFWLTYLLAAAARRRLRNRILWRAVLTLIVGVAMLMLARKVFAGPGIRQTFVGCLGPWAVPALALLGAWLTPWAVTRLEPNGWARVPRWALAAVAIALSVALAVLEAHAVGMLFLQILMLVLGLLLAFHALELIRFPALAGYTTMAVSLLCTTSLCAFPSSRPARELLGRSGWAGSQLIDYIKFHVDFDHDGYSPLFGAGDCNDADPSVFVGAPERSGDGRDSDCDGDDDPKPTTLLFEPFQPRPDRAVQQIIERARQFPTVVILVDALRFDRVENSRFPNLAQLARESIRFMHAYSISSTTLSSVPAIMSGRARPARGRDNIAQSLKRAGQSSRLIAPDAITEHFKNLREADPLSSFSTRDIIPTDRTAGWGAGATIPTSDRITAAAIERLDAAQPPDLLWLHYFDVHQWDILEEDGLPKHGDFARYDSVLERMDHSLRPLLERRDRVNIVLLADHGESLGARGVRSHTDFTFEEVTRIPLLVHIPGARPRAVELPVTSPSVFNTLRVMRGLEPDASVDSSLFDLLGDSGLGAGPGLPGFDTAQWSLLYGKLRLLYMPQEQLTELYDLEKDPLEHRNLADDEPQLASDLLARLFQIHNEPPQ